METEFGSVFHDTSRPTQLSTFVWKFTPVFTGINFSNRIAAVVSQYHLYISRSPQPSNIAPITAAILKIHAYQTGTRMLLTSFSLRWFIIRLFYKAEPATEFIMARGRTGMYIKKAPMANIKVFSQAGIRIIPECSSPHSKLIHSNPIRTKHRRREASFHTHRRNQQNSRQ